MIDYGFLLDPELRPALYKWMGRTPNPDLWEQHVTGHRVLIVPTPVLETWKGILYKPRSAHEREQLEAGSGCVVAVGSRVGKPGAPHPVGVECDDPRDLLGRFVLFRQLQGVNLRTSEDDSEFGGQHALIMLTDRDILSVGQGLVMEDITE